MATKLSDLIAKQKQATAAQVPVEPESAPTPPTAPAKKFAMPGKAPMKFALATPKPAPVPAPAPASPSKDGFSIDSINEIEPDLPEDHIPVSDVEMPQAPDRANRPDPESPEGQFVSQLDALYEVFGDAELVSQVVKQIMMELAQHPEYSEQIADADVNTMIRAMRASMGMAKIKKAESKAKKSGGSRKNSADLAIVDDALAGLFK